VTASAVAESPGSSAQSLSRDRAARAASRPRAFDLVAFQPDGGDTTSLEEAVSNLAARLNDVRRTRIADHRQNNWTVSFVSTDVHELASLATALEALGIEYQTNYARAEDPRRAERHRAFLAIYDHQGQTQLLEAVRPLLAGPRLLKLEELVAARGPLSDELLRRMTATIAFGKDHAYLADGLNRQGIIAGMGGHKWTARKVRKALTQWERSCARESNLTRRLTQSRRGSHSR
jgi:hypothetical protein